MAFRRLRHPFPQSRVVPFIRKQHRPHPKAVHQVRHAGNVVIIVMAQHQIVKPLAAHAEKLVRGVPARALPASHGAAVHHGELPAGGHGGAASLPHIHRHNVQRAPGIKEPAKFHRHRQGQCRQHRRHSIFAAGLGLPQVRRAKQEVEVYQPVFQKRVRVIQRVVRDFCKNLHHRQHIGDQRPWNQRQKRGGRHPHKRQQDGNQPRPEDQAHGPQAQEV
ncbi:hypothetical protein SDC9_140583 [bioreactor metagenome]|uniref:Uncharacterized protein n=1 Tax=bioreactor metagenome TaxID=1076179 RepID=A0A645DVT8_9ZZZZ